MRNKLRKILAVATILLLGELSFCNARPAMAASSDCVSGNICLWNAVNYSGAPWQWSIGWIRQQDGDCLQLTPSASNIASSLAVRGMLSSTRVVFFDLVGGGATRAVTGVSSYWDQDLRYAPGMTDFSNRISSICIF